MTSSSHSQTQTDTPIASESAEDSLVHFESTRFGSISVAAERIIRFVRPIIGFEQLTQYIMVDHEEESPFRWLQSVEEGALAFVVSNPAYFEIDYEFDVPDDVIEELEIQNPEEMVVLTIVRIPHGKPNDMTANLLGPIIVNSENLKAAQIILNQTEYSTRTPLIPAESGEGSMTFISKTPS